LLSLTTTSQHGQGAALQDILDGLSTLPIRVLVTLGGTATAGQLRVPANTYVSGFVPHELVLPYMSAVVTHAGMSTTAMALAAGVPMVCVPQGRDQGGNAERVVSIGAGLIAGAGNVAGAVSTLMADPRYSSAAQRIANACARLGRGAHATDLVEALTYAREGERVAACG